MRTRTENDTHMDARTLALSYAGKQVRMHAHTHAYTYAHTSVRHVPTPALRLIPKYELPGSRSKLLEALPTLKAAVKKSGSAFYTYNSGVSK